MQVQNDEPYTEIDTAMAQEMINAGRVYVIDVREPGEWKEGHLEKSTLVPLNTFLKKPREHLKGDNVLFVCAMGQRSAVASEMAAALGMEHVYNLAGGLTTWRQRGLPLVQ